VEAAAALTWPWRVLAAPVAPRVPMAATAVRRERAIGAALGAGPRVL